MSSKPTSPKTTPKPKAVYNHALHFMATDGFMRKQVDGDRSLMPMLQYPGMVISAFASELFLKCLILLEKKVPKNTHNLLTLYEQLSVKHKGMVERHWDEGCAARKDLNRRPRKRVQSHHSKRSEDRPLRLRRRIQAAPLHLREPARTPLLHYTSPHELAQGNTGNHEVGPLTTFYTWRVMSKVLGADPRHHRHLRGMPPWRPTDEM